MVISAVGISVPSIFCKFNTMDDDHSSRAVYLMMYHVDSKMDIKISQGLVPTVTMSYGSYLQNHCFNLN